MRGEALSVAGFKPEGLAIARHIAELHNGTIHAESVGEGQEVVFTVRLPLLQKRDDCSSIQPDR
ncbi:hypothetical protein H6G89_13135 [Oscillatoria sp. FACHB-1407]|uniref:hypothetical protein n=1 Tax=Oscillatoria sp. FACHB-1407 TaxID=2692847 RepID=UPI0016841864|nr:hypothetical protein [Oscillatoria sp. FACHB-1407]MBD2461992.1 hypothetical protein [Oscillatoria sp. FACHB-1407]